MDITTKNFDDLLPKVKECIDQAEFLTFDLELTGLHWDDEAQPTIMDDWSTRYQKVRETATSFAIIQFGLCCFSRDDVKNTMTEEAEIRAKIKLSEERDEISITESCQKFIEDTMSKIEDWLQTSTEKSMILAPCNALFRRLVYQEVGKKYGDGLYLESKGNRENSTMKSIEIKRLTSEERKQIVEEKRHYVQTELEKAVGFRRVVDAICESKKLVIGHNMLLDLCFFMAQLIGSIPESLEDFKTELLHHLPRILDTKHLATANSVLQATIPSTNLEDMINTLKTSKFESPEISLDLENHSYEKNLDLFHEAGYDAYQTGYAFLKMIYHMRSQNILSFEDHLGVTSSPELNDYVNKLYLMRSDPPVMRLDGEDIPPNRRNVFFLCDFPKDWKHSHVSDVFKNFNTLSVKWVGETEVRVVVNHECVEDILDAIETNEARKDKQYSIYTEECYRARRNLIGSPCFVARDLKKRRISICRSPSIHGSERLSLPLN